ncbi:MAG: hypothetical protein EHM79_02045 [Geobacter sp.]|nr:MAG: hypothetical protein EHM79_02045 [Geobacter sp.]
MKPPYAQIIARCNKHGEFTVQRKPNPKTGQRDPNGSGALIQRYPHAIVCPKCRMWAKITNLVEIPYQAGGVL